MLISAKSLKGHTLNGIDGDIGKTVQFYFDDQYWTIRYLVVDTGDWLTDRQVLISPHALISVSGEKQDIAVSLTRKQIENSPPLDTDKPVSRQYEQDYYGFYGWPFYWEGPYMWGYYIDARGNEAGIKKDHTESWDPHLRSTSEVEGYDIHATDGDIGHVEDFIIDDETWAIRYLVVKTRNWLPGRRVLVAPEWIREVSWPEAKVYVDLSRESLKSSPEFTQDFLISREYEDQLHRHYQRKGYWDGTTMMMKNRF